MATYISGCVLSSLCFEQLNSKGHQEGFLLGRVEDHVCDTISDSQISNQKVEKRIYIYSHRPWSKINKLCNQDGHISENAFNRFFKDFKKDIIGWYKFRRNSSMRMSMKEISIHKNICSDAFLPNTSDFQFMLSCFSPAANHCTHSLDYSFYMMKEGEFIKVPVTVVNLGDTTHSEYKLQRISSVNLTSGVFPSFVKQFESAFLDPGGRVTQLHKVRKMNASLNNKLQELSNFVNVSEQQVGELEQEVRKLQDQLQKKEEEKKKLLPLPNPISQEELEIIALEKKLDAHMDKLMINGEFSPNDRPVVKKQEKKQGADTNTNSSGNLERSSSFQRNSIFRRRLSETSSHPNTCRTRKQKSKNVPIDLLSTDNPPVPSSDNALIDLAGETAMQTDGSNKKFVEDDVIQRKDNMENIKNSTSSVNEDAMDESSENSVQSSKTNDHFSFIASVVQQEKNKNLSPHTQKKARPNTVKSLHEGSSQKNIDSGCEGNSLHQSDVTYIMDGEVPGTSDQQGGRKLRSRGLRAKSKPKLDQGMKNEKTVEKSSTGALDGIMGIDDTNISEERHGVLYNWEDSFADNKSETILSSSPVF